MKRAWIVAGVLSLLLVACATPAGAPSREARQSLAPTGAVRVAFLQGPLYATREAPSAELKGVAVDLGRALARALEVSFQPVVYPNPGAVLAGGKAGEWDVALMGINAERAAVVDFSAPYMEVELGYLVRAGVAIASMAEVDRAGIRVGVIERTGADTVLSGSLKQATLVRVKTVPELVALLDAGQADAVASAKTGLFAEAAKRSGWRVLDGRILVEPIGMGVIKGREPAAAAFVGRFVEDAKARGTVKAAIDAAGLRGVVVAPPK